MVSATERRDWALYEDWCASWNRPPAPADNTVVDEFLAEFPAKRSTQLNRVRAIRNELERRGFAMAPRPRPPAASLIRLSPAHASLPEALAQLPRSRRVDGFRGRRDAWLLVLIGVLQLTRREARGLSVDDIDVSLGIRIRGRFIPTGPDPLTCPACAVTRWLRVVGVYGVGFRLSAFEVLDPRVALVDDHDCETPLDDVWQQAMYLLPAIDQHGWVRTEAPMSLRSISAVAARVQLFTGNREQAFVTRVATGRFADASSAELVVAQDEVDDEAAELVRRSAELLAAFDDLG